MLFDVKDFYPSINETLLKNSLQFAETLTDINDKEKEIIHHSRKSLLFNNRESWMKKVVNSSTSRWVHMMELKFANW